MRLGVTAVTSSSVELQWGQQPDLPQGIPDLGMYYGYRLVYRWNYSVTLNEYGNYVHNAQASHLSTVVEGLEFNRPYIFILDPYREWEGVRDYGWAYPWAAATTACRGKSVVSSAWHCMVACWSEERSVVTLYRPTL